MEDRIILNGRAMAPGVAEGEALVSPEVLQGWNGFDPKTGIIIQEEHSLKGECLSGKVFVFVGSRGSTGFSTQFHAAQIYGTAPAALILLSADSRTAATAAIAKFPIVTDLEADPFEIIRNGDLVRVDGDAGTVEITRRG